ncbi:replication-associated recombination protein A [bacterium]|nr:replication-associated recombination protein A [bacterium]
MNDSAYIPLYSVLRPETFDDVVGQQNVIRLLKSFLKSGFLPSMVFYGPPGTGKTTVARIAAGLYGAKLYKFSAVTDSSADIKKILYKDRESVFVKKQIVFIDEIHRFNRAQQDIFLPMIENEGVIFIGATTENPSFYVNNALLSRARSVRFSKISVSDIITVLHRAVDYLKAGIDEELLEIIAKEASGDVRIAVSIMESAFHLSGDGKIRREHVMELVENPTQYDKTGDFHYRTISAFIKSLRGSDPDAALYYLVKMIESGDNPLFLLRRMIIFASEDVGNADPRALELAVSALQAFQAVGYPEGKIIMAHIVNYLATAPKSNASYLGLHAAEDYFKENPSLEIPNHLINDSSFAPGEEKGNYKYPHDYENHWVDQRYFPGDVEPPVFYKMKNIGYEAKIREYWEKIRKKPGS